jgi:hypothetical protein
VQVACAGSSIAQGWVLVISEILWGTATSSSNSMRQQPAASSSTKNSQQIKQCKLGR